MDKYVKEDNKVVYVGDDIDFDEENKFFECLVRFEYYQVKNKIKNEYDVYNLDGRNDGGYYKVKECVNIEVIKSKKGNNVYVGLMVWYKFKDNK